jgi:hypothetical protein
MGPLEFVMKSALDASPHHPGFQTRLLYIVLNLAIPILLGIVLAWITRLVEKGLNLLLGVKR